MADYYKVLELTKLATADDIKKAYKRLAKKYHPDSNKDADAVDKFKLVSEAYDLLSDVDKRKKYDSGIKIEVKPTRNTAKVIRKEVFLPEEIGKRSPVNGFTPGRLYAIIAESGEHYTVVNDFGKAIRIDIIYFVAPHPGINPAFNHQINDGHIYYDGQIVNDQTLNQPLPRRK